MIYFFADDHFNMHCGQKIFENLPQKWKDQIVFVENDWTLLESGEWLKDCDLLILNLIATTCNLPHPGEGAEKSVRIWCERGGNALLLHGSSAAFWGWNWWRKIVGYRWVRPGDPDGVEKSVHPVKPFSLRLCKVRHPLAEKLIPFDLEEDEIYTELEQVSPTITFLETEIEEGVYPQCFETITPWGGKFLTFLPGHRPTATENEKLIANISTMITYLLEGK